MKVGVIVNVEKKNVSQIIKRIVLFLKKRKVESYVQKRRGYQVTERLTPALLASLDLCIVLGGDGTVLSACRQVARYNVPILAVHLGGFGFLTEVEPEKFERAWDFVEQKRYLLDKRMMLEIKIGNRRRTFYALNDAVVAQKVFSRLCDFRIKVGSRVLTTYPADGIIVSTPTGSTAYNLSASGPLVHPSLSLFILNPICAHTLYARPIILGGKEHIAIQARGQDQKVVLTLDGQEGIPLNPEEPVYIREAPYVANLIRFQEDFFYRKLREKLRWGDFLE